jgi:hypothetical protein
MATTEGVVRAPSVLAMTVGWPPSMTATTELVVPKSIPTALPIKLTPMFYMLAPPDLQGCLISAYLMGSRKTQNHSFL